MDGVLRHLDALVTKPGEKYELARQNAVFEPSSGVCMVGGHERIKMSTSVIDYVFRDLAITYPGRDDLAQVSTEDTRHDALGGGNKEGKADKEPPVKAEVRSIAVAQAVAAAGGALAPVAGGARPLPRAAAALDQARVMGYEGDPCPECGALTLVRNGTCLKCNTCGATTGCS